MGAVTRTLRVLATGLLAAVALLGCSGGDLDILETRTAVVDSGGAGAGGAPQQPPSGGPAGTSSEPLLSLIDDFEDGDITILLVEGRGGDWYKYSDGSGTNEHALLTIPHERQDGGYAGRFVGTNFSTWGAGLGVPMVPVETDYYDARGYIGIEFWARARLGTTTDLRINFPNRDTRTVGGICNPDESAADRCEDHYGQDLTISFAWERYSVYFGTLRQVGFGATLPAFDLEHFHDIQFLAGVDGGEFDVWIDDLAFIVEGGG
jgi:hypothetical protein